jgi:hypothetical protein
MITMTCLATLWLLGSAEAGNAATVEARRLASVPQDSKLKGVFHSPDPRRVGLIASRGAKEFAVLDGVLGEEFDAISSPLTFSPTAGASPTSPATAPTGMPSSTASAAKGTTRSSPLPSAPTARGSSTPPRGARAGISSSTAIGPATTTR